jgi:hypothetical protein
MIVGGKVFAKLNTTDVTNYYSEPIGDIMLQAGQMSRCKLIQLGLPLRLRNGWCTSHRPIDTG